MIICKIIYIAKDGFPRPHTRAMHTATRGHVQSELDNLWCSVRDIWQSEIYVLSFCSHPDTGVGDCSAMIPLGHPELLPLRTECHCNYTPREGSPKARVAAGRMHTRKFAGYVPSHGCKVPYSDVYHKTDTISIN